VDSELDEVNVGNEPIESCRKCGRWFSLSKLRKHVPSCESEEVILSSDDDSSPVEESILTQNLRYSN
jgi:Zn finger protein HypA/HybF involved in hydrogenase expression